VVAAPSKKFRQRLGYWEERISELR
jgi:hypothetical protein